MTLLRWLALGVALSAPMARADVGIELDCTIQAGSGFDCVQLRQKFFGDNAVSFFKEKEATKAYAQTLKVTVGRQPVMNGWAYQIVVAETGKPNARTFSSSTFVSDQANAASVTVSNPNAPPSLAGLSPEQIAEDEVKFSAQAAAGSSWSYGANLSLSYTFGDGVNITSQDQRGIAIR